MALEEEFLTPKGYRFTSKFQYPQKFFNTMASLTPLLALLLYLLADFGVFLPLPQGSLFIMMILTIFSPYAVRKAVQKGVSSLFGYPFSWGPHFLLFFLPGFPVEEGEYRSYRDALFVALAPLSLYIILLIPLLLGQRGTIGNMLTFALLVGLLLTASDIYFACWLLTKPKSSTLYMKRRTAWLFEPLSAEQRAQAETEAHMPEQLKRRRHRKTHHH